MQTKRKPRGPGTWRLACLVLLLFIPVGRDHAREQKTIQKTPTNLQAKAADTYLDQSAPATANGNSASLRVQSSLFGGNRRAVVLFDFSILPNVGIKSATLIM